MRLSTGLKVLVAVAFAAVSIGASAAPRHHMKHHRHHHHHHHMNHAPSHAPR